MTAFEKILLRADPMCVCRVIQNIIQLKPKSKYFLAVDKSKDTLESIVEVAFCESYICMRSSQKETRSARLFRA